MVRRTTRLWRWITSRPARGRLAGCGAGAARRARSGLRFRAPPQAPPGGCDTLARLIGVARAARLIVSQRQAHLAGGARALAESRRRGPDLGRAGHAQGAGSDDLARRTARRRRLRLDRALLIQAATHVSRSTQGWPQQYGCPPTPVTRGLDFASSTPRSSPRRPIARPTPSAGGCCARVPAKPRRRSMDANSIRCAAS